MLNHTLLFSNSHGGTEPERFGAFLDPQQRAITTSMSAPGVVTFGTVGGVPYGIVPSRIVGSHHLSQSTTAPTMTTSSQPG